MANEMGSSLVEAMKLAQAKEQKPTNSDTVKKAPSAATLSLKQQMEQAQAQLKDYEAVYNKDPNANVGGNMLSGGGYGGTQAQNLQSLQYYQDALKKATSAYNTQADYEATGRNADGSWLRPEWQSNLDDSTGLLQEPYVLGKDYQGQAINTQGLDQFRKEALRAEGTDSLWASLQKAQTQLKSQKDMDSLAAQQNSGLAAAFDNMGATGGVSSGSRERMAANSLRDALRGRQEIRGQANSANLQIGTQDEINRQSNLKALPGMEQAQGAYNLQNDQAKFQVQQYNIDNALKEKQAKRNDDMQAWTKNQEVWGAQKQSEAQKSSSGGGGGCCFIFLEARYGNGTMDSVVRRFRDEHMTERNKRGYYKLSEVLVPLMRKSKLVKTLVRVTMTTPLVSYGKYHYGQGRMGIFATPLKNFWLKAFDYLGQDHEFIRENGETV